MNKKISWLKMGVGGLLIATSSATYAQGFFGDLFDNVDVGFSGFIRAEGTYRTTSQENQFNQVGNIFNDQTISRTAYAPPELLPEIVRGLIPIDFPIGLPPIGNWNTLPLGVGGLLFQDEIRRGDYIPSTTNDTNYTVLRAETELAIQMGWNWRIVARARGLFDPTVYNDFDARGVSGGAQGGIDGGNARLYAGRPSYFEYRVENDKRGNPLEFSGRNYMVDFPALLLEYTSGGLNVRVGNQQIAWGQAIFFRVLDVPNGLDLRRHTILDRAMEEFSDKRVPMLSARVTYQMTNNILADAYVGKFQPTVFGNPNTGYNIVPTQFTVQDMFREGGFDDEISYGLRLKGDYGRWGWQAVAARRWNPDGTFRWTESRVAKDLPNQGLGALVETLYGLGTGPSDCGPTTGDALARTPFEASPGGVYSADEWFNYAGQARLSGFHGLNAAIDEFPCAKALFASVVDPNDADAMAQSTNQLNTFFMAAGGALRGHIAREYHQENVFGLGLSYVTESDRSEFLNQLIFNLEVSYQPRRTFTNTSLSREFIVEDEWTAALVMDKWHRFFNNFPGTYIVGQVLHKTESDLVGRHLSGYGGTQENGMPEGRSSASYLVAGFLQPFPNKIWEVEFAGLWDPRGGLFLQPGVRWNPGRSITVEGFYNYVDGELRGNPNDNLISTLGFAEEFSLRLTYQF
jgi:hypothetical protein